MNSNIYYRKVLQLQKQVNELNFVWALNEKENRKRGKAANNWCWQQFSTVSQTNACQAFANYDE